MLQHYSSNCTAFIHLCFVFLPPPDSTNDQFQPSAYLFMSVLHLVPLCCRCISSSIMWRLASYASGSDAISSLLLLTVGLCWTSHTCTLSCAHTGAAFARWIIGALSFSSSVFPQLWLSFFILSLSWRSFHGRGCETVVFVCQFTHTRHCLCPSTYYCALSFSVTRSPSLCSPGNMTARDWVQPWVASSGETTQQSLRKLQCPPHTVLYDSK